MNPLEKAWSVLKEDKCDCGCAEGKCKCPPDCDCGCNHKKGGADWAQNGEKKKKMGCA